MSRLHLQAVFWEERPPHTKKEELSVNLIHGNKSKGQKPVHSVYQLTKGVRSFSLELVASTFTGPVALRHVESSQTRARARVPCIGRQILNHCATREAHWGVLSRVILWVWFCISNITLAVMWVIDSGVIITHMCKLCWGSSESMMLDVYVQLSYKADTHTNQWRSKIGCYLKLFLSSFRHYSVQRVRFEARGWKGCSQDPSNSWIQWSKVNKCEMYSREKP